MYYRLRSVSLDLCRLSGSCRHCAFGFQLFTMHNIIIMHSVNFDARLLYVLLEILSSF